MKNPFEGLSRREKFDETKKDIKEKTTEVDKLEHPLGKPKATWITDEEMMGYGMPDTEAFVLAIKNAIASIPNLPKIKFLEWRIKSAGNKLKNIYEKDHDEAIKLNAAYESIIKKAAESGDDTELREFERSKLGMADKDLESEEKIA